ncbi:MAG TPA: hypothetical protein VNR18_13470 [Hyphomicrobiales bacterium]|nr:hypothetical protein [Hyphomicrobiales bacterium]
MSAQDHVLFLFNNLCLADGVGVSASSEASADLEAENLLTPNRWEIWRGEASETEVTIDITLAEGSEVAVGIAALVDSNLSSNGTIRLQSWSDSIEGSTPGADVTVNALEALSGYGMGGFGTGGYGGGATKETLGLVRPISFIPLGDFYMDRYWRFTLRDESLDYLQAAIPYLGDFFQPSSNYSWGAARELEYRTKRRESRGGQKFGRRRAPRMVLTGELLDMETPEADLLWLQHLRGENSTPFICCFKPDQGMGQLLTAIYGVFDGAKIADEYANHHNTTIRIIEEL